MTNEEATERIIDRRVQQRLAIDREYLNAANAEEQAIREDEIVEQEEAQFYAERREIEIGEGMQPTNADERELLIRQQRHHLDPLAEAAKGGWEES